MAESIIEYIQSNSLAWQIRFILAQSFENSSKNHKQSLKEMFKDTSIDYRVHIGIGVALANQGERDSISCLRKAIEEKTIPFDLEIENYTHYGYFGNPIVSALNKLGDDYLVPILIEEFNNQFSSNSFVLKADMELASILNTIAIYKPDAFDLIYIFN